MFKISFDLDLKNNSGKHKFINRLRQELSINNFIEVPITKSADFHLFVNSINPKAKYNIYRIDGVWLNLKNKDSTENTRIIHNIKKSRAVIFQNEFCRDAVINFLQTTPKRYNIILNGADPKEFENLPKLNEPPYFLALCKWRPHKRLNTIIESFIESKINTNLIIIGEPEKTIKHPKIKYYGWKDKTETNILIKNCIATIHLAWLDWCPNSVIESIVARKPVIYTNSGGTKHIVKNRGYEVPDIDWNFNTVDLYNPPLLNTEHIIKCYHEALENKRQINNISDLNIKHIAKLYFDYIKGLYGN